MIFVWLNKFSYKNPKIIQRKISFEGIELNLDLVGKYSQVPTMVEKLTTTNESKQVQIGSENKNIKSILLFKFQFIEKNW